MKACPRCGFDISGQDAGLEPLFTLDEATLLVPCGRSQLKGWLANHKGLVSPAQYIWNQRQRRRLLPASDIKIIRASLVSTTRFPEWRRLSKAFADTRPR